MRKNMSYFPFDEETDRLFYDDEMPGCERPSFNPNPHMDEEEAHTYNSVYDIPLTYRHKKYGSKQ